jgi:hypothetical protein
MRPSPISVSLIAGAEEARIGRTLASVAGWTSEVVVVLNEEVSDRTEAIARQAGAVEGIRPTKKLLAGEDHTAMGFGIGLR